MSSWKNRTDPKCLPHVSDQVKMQLEHFELKMLPVESFFLACSWLTFFAMQVVLVTSHPSVQGADQGWQGGVSMCQKGAETSWRVSQRHIQSGISCAAPIWGGGGSSL